MSPLGIIAEWLPLLSIVIGINFIPGKTEAASFTVFPIKGASFWIFAAIIFKAPSSKSWLFVNPELLINNLTSLTARFSGEIISSIPIDEKSNLLPFSMNSVFVSLAIVLLAPNFLASIHVKKLIDSLAVTPITRSAFETFAFFKDDGDVESPLTTFISR